LFTVKPVDRLLLIGLTFRSYGLPDVWI